MLQDLDRAFIVQLFDVALLALGVGLDPTVLSPAAKSISGRFSGGSGHEKGQIFDKTSVLSKVVAPAPCSLQA
jgi:hypothetical protein